MTCLTSAAAVQEILLRNDEMSNRTHPVPGSKAVFMAIPPLVRLTGIFSRAFNQSAGAALFAEVARADCKARRRVPNVKRPLQFYRCLRGVEDLPDTYFSTTDENDRIWRCIAVSQEQCFPFEPIPELNGEPATERIHGCIVGCDSLDDLRNCTCRTSLTECVDVRPAGHSFVHPAK